MLELLRLFTSLGIPVFPIAPGSKIPHKDTNGVKDATTDFKQIEEWMDKWPDSNWAMATGRHAGIIVLDIDPRNGGDVSIKEKISQYGTPPKTPTVKTGGGGYHYYYRYSVLHNIKNGDILDGVDIKTDGGYVLIPGSFTESEYRWANGLSITDVELADLPGWIIELATVKKGNYFNEQNFVITGNRNNYLTSVAGSMRRRGMGEAAIAAALREENLGKCSPPLENDEVDRIVVSIMSYKPDDELLLKFMDGDNEDIDIRNDAIKSERAVIGYLLKPSQDEVIVSEIFSNIESEHFIDSMSRDIFVAFKELYNRRATLSRENVKQILADKELSFDVDLNIVFDELSLKSTIFTLGDVTFHIERIIEAWTLVKSFDIYKRALHDSAKGHRKAGKIIGETTAALARLTDSGTKSHMFTSQDAVRAVRKIMADSKSGLFQAFQRTGMPFIDDMIMGLPKGEITIIAGRPSQGKAFTIDSELVTPWGTTTYGEVMPGDYVFGADGRPTRVTGVFPQGVLPVYEVEFKDGSIERVSGEHLWAVNGRNQRKRGIQNFRVVTTDYIREHIKKNNGRVNFVTPVSPEVHYPAKRLPIDPYVLGVLLADGGLTTDYLGITTGDEWIIHEVERLLPENHIMRKRSHNEYEWSLVNPVTRRNEIKQALRDLQLDGLGSWDKFIPEMYLTASVEQRVNLLQGLMDSDGSVNNETSGRYLTASVKLADDIVKLVRSLGGYITRTVKYVDGVGYQRMYLSFPNKPDWKPFRLPRKADIYRHYTKTYYGKPIVDVRPAGEAECVCISVENEDGLYLTSNYNVTHNTAFALKVAYSTLEEAKKRNDFKKPPAAVIFSAEMTAAQLMVRNVSREAKVNSKYIVDARTIDIEDQIRVDRAMEYIYENVNMFIDETPNPSPQYIAAKLASITRDYEIVVVVMDYAELGGMDEEDHNIQNKSLRLEENLKKYKIIAKLGGFPFILLSQVGRAVEDRATATQEPVPRLADLRWSGMIEQIAYIVMMVYYPWFFYNMGIAYPSEPAKDYYEIIVVKNRNGEIGTIPARFIKQYGDFENGVLVDLMDETTDEFAWEK